MKTVGLVKVIQIVRFSFARLRISTKFRKLMIKCAKLPISKIRLRTLGFLKSTKLAIGRSFSLFWTRQTICLNL